MSLGTAGSAVCDADAPEGGGRNPPSPGRSRACHGGGSLPGGTSLPADQHPSGRVLLHLPKLNLRDYLQRVAPIFSPGLLCCAAEVG